MNLHAKGAHQPRRRDADIAEAENAAHAARSILLELRWLKSPRFRLSCSRRELRLCVIVKYGLPATRAP
jgi:hypothetical protein